MTVHAVQDPTVNAFATLGGHVFVFTGLVDSLDSENGLAMVLAHELAQPNEIEVAWERIVAGFQTYLRGFDPGLAA